MNIKNEIDTNGFFCIDNFLSTEECKKLKSLLENNNANIKQLMPNDYLVSLIMKDKIQKIVEVFFNGNSYRFHHAHGRVSKIYREKNWHHDYDKKGGWCKGMPKMLHVMIYPNGLPDSVSPLVIRPTSHLNFVDRGYPNQFGCIVDKNDIIIKGVVNTVVFMNSATWHMRPLISDSDYRYDINISFCENTKDNSIFWEERQSHINAFIQFSNLSGLFYE